MMISFLSIGLWWLYFITPISSIRFDDKSYGKQFHDYSMELISQNNYEDALDYFRAAVRADQSSLLYLNDLGVTEMNLGLYLKAYSRFHSMLSKDPNHIDGIDNLNVLRQLYPLDNEQILFNSSYISTVMYNNSCDNITINSSINTNTNNNTAPSQHININSINNTNIRHHIQPVRTLYIDDILSHKNDTISELLKYPFIIKNIKSILHLDYSINDIIYKLLFDNNVRGTVDTLDWSQYTVDFYPHNMSKYNSVYIMCVCVICI